MSPGARLPGIGSDGHHRPQRPRRSSAPLTQDSNATALRDVAAAGVPVAPAGDGDRQERHGADMAADLPAGYREGQPLAGPLRTKIPVRYAIKLSGLA